MYVCIHTHTQIYIYMCISVYIYRYRVQGISRNYAQKLRREFQAPTPKIQETRKAYSKTFAKLAPQHGHAFLDAI